MKKLVYSIIFLLTLVSAGQSFGQTFKNGDKLLNAGVGLAAYYGGGFPIGASFEVGITDEISVGAQIDYYSWTYGFSSIYNPRYTFIPIAVRGSYHVNELLNLGNDKLDLYGGAALGYYISSYSDNTGYTGLYNNGYGGRLLFNIHAGGRYYFKENLGAFAELGYGVAALKVGVTFKF
jgi:hypothetical protein